MLVLCRPQQRIPRMDKKALSEADICDQFITPGVDSPALLYTCDFETLFVTHSITCG